MIANPEVMSGGPGMYDALSRLVESVGFETGNHLRLATDSFKLESNSLSITFEVYARNGAKSSITVDARDFLTKASPDGKGLTYFLNDVTENRIRLTAQELIAANS